MPGFLHRYNGKPFLTRPQHRFYHGPDYFEIDIDVHNFTYIARKSAYTFLQGKLQAMVCDCGLVIEARSEDEMPEQVLGALTLTCLTPENAPEWQPPDKGPDDDDNE
eukprot:TRINITY_DN67365_c8_g2_i1.p2 TRINITY_DN67365_c8_g2~~TRINITY_DN67365_c8_g2_i1.p2  ORF type:complete len:107 (-),score=53.27 TRINITY_DN67365_c8_g2_i1:63-383(-)